MVSHRKRFIAAVLGAWCSVLCFAPQLVLAQQHASGLNLQSSEVDFDVDLANDAARRGIDFEPRVKRGSGNALIHFESPVPLRFRNVANRADAGNIPGRFLDTFKGEMGLKNVDSMVVDRVRELKGGKNRTHPQAVP